MRTLIMEKPENLGVALPDVFSSIWVREHEHVWFYFRCGYMKDERPKPVGNNHHWHQRLCMRCDQMEMLKHDCEIRNISWFRHWRIKHSGVEVTDRDWQIIDPKEFYPRWYKQWGDIEEFNNPLFPLLKYGEVVK